MRSLFIFVTFVLLLSCSSTKNKPELENEPTAEDFLQLFGWFKSVLLIYTDDSLDPEVEQFLNNEIKPRWQNNAYVYLWGASVRTDDPYGVGLEIAHLVKQADENYQYEKVPYDDSFFKNYEYLEFPEGKVFCKSYDSGCLGSVINSESDSSHLIESNMVFRDRYLTFLEFPYMDEVSLKYLASPFPKFRLLLIGQRIHHLSLLRQLKQGNDIVPDLLKELKLIRIKLTQGTSLIDKMIMHLLASTNVELFSHLIQAGLVDPNHSDLKAGISMLTTQEISTKRVLMLEHLSGMRLFNKFLRDVELMVSNKPRKPYVMPLMRMIGFMLAKPNLTLNTQYNSVIKPLLTYTELNANEFYKKYDSKPIQSSHDCIRNYLSCVLLGEILDYKPIYLTYQGRLYSLDMKIQLLNGLITEGSFDGVLQKAKTDGLYLNTYNASLPFKTNEKICYSGIFKENDRHRCLEVFKP